MVEFRVVVGVGVVEVRERRVERAQERSAR